MEPSEHISELRAFVDGHPRYSFMPRVDYFTVVCHDCSTRTLTYTLPSDQMSDHEQWHAEMMRTMGTG